jgi:hypothetical protein
MVVGDGVEGKMREGYENIGKVALKDARDGDTFIVDGGEWVLDKAALRRQHFKGDTLPNSVSCFIVENADCWRKAEVLEFESEGIRYRLIGEALEFKGTSGWLRTRHGAMVEILVANAVKAAKEQKS